jgi:periplasmic protein TonB
MSDPQCRDSLSTPTTGAERITETDVLSESTDLDTLLTAILGESDSVSTIRSAPDAIAAADDVPQGAEYAIAGQPLAMNLAAIPSAWLAEGPSESGVKKVADGPATPSAGHDKSPTVDLASLRNRLQGSRGAISPLRRSDALPNRPANRRLMTADAESDRRAAPKLLVVVDEQLTTPSDPAGMRQVSSGEEPWAVEGTHPVHPPARDAAVSKDARRLTLILVGVVVVSGALITLNALSRAFSPPPLPPISATSDGREVAADAAALNTPAITSAPPAASAADGRQDRRTTPLSRSAVGRPSGRPVPSAPSPRRTVDAASNPVTPTATRPETPSRSEAPPARPELETPGPDTSVTSASPTTIREPVASAGSGDIPAAPQTPERPQAQLPTATAANPPRSAAAATSRTPPRLIQGSTPEYPSVLRAARVRGLVEVQLTIDETGRVTRAAAVSGPAALREAAERAVRAWRYEPAPVNGVHAPATTTVSFRFEPK